MCAPLAIVAGLHGFLHFGCLLDLGNGLHAFAELCRTGRLLSVDVDKDFRAFNFSHGQFSFGFRSVFCVAVLLWRAADVERPKPTVASRGVFLFVEVHGWDSDLYPAI